MNLQKETLSYYEEYQNLVAENRTAEAVFLMEQRALMILNLLGVAYSSVFDNQEKAKKCFDTVLQIDPTNVNACSNLSHIMNIRGNLNSGVEYSNRSIIYSGGTSYEGFYNQGVILLALGKTKEAIVMFEKALALEPNNPNANYNLGLSLLKTQMCQEGWDKYDSRFETNKVCKIFKSRCTSYWNGEDLKDKTLFIFNEQGLGDFIFFLRFIPEVKKLGCKIICELQRSLYPLVKHLFSEEEITFREDAGNLPALPVSDYQVSICSLPKMLQIDGDSKIPANIKFQLSQEEKPEIFSKNNFNVGICWFGNPNHVKDFVRSTYVSNFKPILDIPDVSFFGLGKTDNKPRNWPSGQANLNKDIEALNLINLDSQIYDFNDLKNFIGHLDLIITVDTSIVHLAGSLGKKTWLLLGKESDFRWKENTEQSPWYPSVRIFRFDDTWEKTIDNVKRSFLEFLHTK